MSDIEEVRDGLHYAITKLSEPFYRDVQRNPDNPINKALSAIDRIEAKRQWIPVSEQDKSMPIPLAVIRSGDFLGFGSFVDFGYGLIWSVEKDMEGKEIDSYSVLPGDLSLPSPPAEQE